MSEYQSIELYRKPADHDPQTILIMSLITGRADHQPPFVMVSAVKCNTRFDGLLSFIDVTAVNPVVYTPMPVGLGLVKEAIKHWEEEVAALAAAAIGGG